MASAVHALNSLLRGASIDDHEEALKLASDAMATAKGSGGGSGGGDALLTAAHTKVVALLKLDRFEEALGAMADGGDGLAERCVLERAYALYKTGALEQAEALASRLFGERKVTADRRAARAARALQHVAAQAAYRADRFDVAAALYTALAADAAVSGNAGEDMDVRINALAAAAQAAWAGLGCGDAGAGAGGGEDLEAFETAYNAGCVALAGGDAARAVVLLRRAQQLCEASEELSDSDKRTELLPILVQQAYALTQLGRHDEAAALHRMLDVAGTAPDSDRKSATGVVAQANALLAEEHGDGTNAYRVQQKAAAIPAPPAGNDRLFAHQARILRRNQYTLDLQCFKFQGVQARTAKQLAVLADAAGPAHALDAGLLDAGVFHAAAKLGPGSSSKKEALRRLQPLLERRPRDVGLLLTAVQLHLQPPQANTEAAAALLEAFLRGLAATDDDSSRRDDRFVRRAPGLVALAVALYRQQGRLHAMRAVLADAVTYWFGLQGAQDTADCPDRRREALSLMRVAGIELLRSPLVHDHGVAAQAFRALLGADPDDPLPPVGILAAESAHSVTVGSGSSESAHSATGSGAVLDRAAASLPSAEELLAGAGAVNAASLLQAGVAALPTAAAVPAPAMGKKRGAEAQGESEAKKQKLQKSGTSTKAPPTAQLSRQARRLQAKRQASGDGSSFDPAKKPDPERWLPLRDRSSYRPPKGRKGGGATQGGNGRRRGLEMQGGVVKEEETLPLAGGAGSVKVEKAAQGSSGGGAAASKKKKKGKR